MNQQLQGKKIAILVDNGFEQIELVDPQQALEDAGAQTFIISPQSDHVRGWNFTEWGSDFSVDVSIDQADPSEYDGLLLPGGVMNPDHLRTNDKAVAFVSAFFSVGKPVAAICHGPWTLINAGVVKGRTMTSYPSLQIDLRNAGANWVDQEVVVDQRLVTSRRESDLPAFNQNMIKEFSREDHERSSTKTLSTAPNNSFETAGDASPGFDSPAETTFAHRNTEVRDSLPTDPYPPQRNRNKSKIWEDDPHKEGEKRR